MHNTISSKATTATRTSDELQQLFIEAISKFTGKSKTDVAARAALVTAENAPKVQEAILGKITKRSPNKLEGISYVDFDSCQFIEGSPSAQGYVKFTYVNKAGETKGANAHRFYKMLELGVEEILIEDENGNIVTAQCDHICHVPGECKDGADCKHRRCVNIRHIAVTTPKENTYRSNGANLTHCKRGHERTPENVNSIGACLTCKSMTTSEWYWNKKNAELYI